jgi:hypothetical protein
MEGSFRSGFNKNVKSFRLAESYGIDTSQRDKFKFEARKAMEIRVEKGNYANIFRGEIRTTFEFKTNSGISFSLSMFSSVRLKSPVCLSALEHTTRQKYPLASNYFITNNSAVEVAGRERVKQSKNGDRNALKEIKFMTRP